ncbi:hypothetical protein OPKNFCMD_5541 [Methylobacterium crusticola]|uniref:Glycosyltransferase family 2 protein n=1 Tax=Methylobacterium crusticola TaxID=1697972 RepID=A0ABQ4R7J2_9HYPH|nr:glycosyltransferase family 2 protein [Methylobacterium crusticola]GJD52774.1 hypothetical protein OPKNFCMD_5541 [Methylobacterium crusticola]
MNLTRLTDAPIRIAPGEVPVVSPVRNEIGLLPHFLRHYRGLGVTTFLFIDNGSTDGSLEYLRAQPDCHLFQCLDSYREAAYGMAWVNRVLAEHCEDRWSVVVDCDELLVYGECESVDLATFCAGVQAKGFDTVAGAMIDMYPGGSFLASTLAPDDDLTEVMGYFDSEYLFRPWPRRPWDRPSRQFDLQVIGGPRLRLLSSLAAERRRGALHYTLCNQVDRFIYRVPLSWVSTVAALWPSELPAQQKRPINLVRKGFRFYEGHSNSNVAYADESIALLHFKLCDEIQKRLSQPTLLENHYRRGLGYEQLRRAVVRWGEAPLTYPGSRRFRTSRDLADLGLIGPTVPRLWREPGLAAIVTPAGPAGPARAHPGPGPAHGRAAPRGIAAPHGAGRS